MPLGLVTSEGVHVSEGYSASTEAMLVFAEQRQKEQRADDFLSMLREAAMKEMGVQLEMMGCDRTLRMKGENLEEAKNFYFPHTALRP